MSGRYLVNIDLLVNRSELVLNLHDILEHLYVGYPLADYVDDGDHVAFVAIYYS